mmetsp:Transcript_19729/g.29098  ORF Transcript_19729/g.29098 Transcript_19729/m.29098 type:complete len:162 (-) Transcript_19729:466-951(-)
MGESDTATIFNEASSEDKTKNDAIIEHLYTDIIKSICVDVASEVHRMAKKGEIPISEMAEIHQNKDDVNSNSSNKKPRLGNRSDNKTINATHNTTEVKQLGEIRLRTRGATSGKDAWNRIPPTDVLTTCKNCCKVLSATRFATHLDKCLGLGTSRSRSLSK